MFSLKSPHRGSPNEYTQYTIYQYEKENQPKLSQICSYGICSEGPKNEFETAVVNEPSVFESLKFYCINPLRNLKVKLFTNYRYLKENFLVPENLLQVICSLR